MSDIKQEMQNCPFCGDNWGKLEFYNKSADLSARIQAAAEEIAKEIKCAYGIATDERDVSDITAIIRRHLEVK